MPRMVLPFSRDFVLPSVRHLKIWDACPISGSEMGWSYLISYKCPSTFVSPLFIGYNLK